MTINKMHEVIHSPHGIAFIMDKFSIFNKEENSGYNDFYIKRWCVARKRVMRRSFTSTLIPLDNEALPFQSKGLLMMCRHWTMRPSFSMHPCHE